MAYTYDEETEVYTVNINEFNDLLKSLRSNTAATPYKIEITGLTSAWVVDPSNNRSIGYILNNNSKYVDLSYTQLPNRNTNKGNCDKLFSKVSKLVKSPKLPPDVTSLNYAFTWCDSLIETPEIPDTVTNMAQCFDRCTSLISITNIPKQVINLSMCFYYCESLTSVPEIPNTVEYMVGCFYGCKNLKSISNIPEGITLMDNLFSECSSLEQLNCEIPESVISMDACFYDCSSLIYPPEIPISVKSMGSTFESCSSLVITPELPSGNDINLTRTFQNCTSLETVINIPDDVSEMTEIFSGCTNLKNIQNWNITKTGSLLNITDYSLFNSIFTNNLEIIHTKDLFSELLLELALNDIASHTSPLPFNINSTVKADTNEIPYVNFEEWISMVGEVPPMIPYKINITEIPIDALAISIIDGAIRCPLGYAIEQYPYKYLDLRDTQLPVIDGLMYAFNNCKSLMYPPKLPDGVRLLTNTFSNCTNLQQQPDLPNGITNMNSTFEGCEDLYEIADIPYSVTSMMQCFMNCTNLRKISNIPVNVKDLSLAFSGCSNLTEISLWEATDFTGTEFDFHLCDKLTDIFTEDVEMEIKVEKSIYKAFENKFSASDIQGSLGNMKQIVKAINTDIPFRILSTWIRWQDHNDIDHPYKIKVTELTQEDLVAEYYHSPLANVLYTGFGDLIEESEVWRHEINVYLDMSETELPDGIISLANCFTGCENLVAAPAIPNTVIDLHGSFSRCYALKEIPEIPQPMKDGFEIPVDLGGAFNHCSMIKTSPKLPRASNISGCFYGCTSLETVKNVPVVEMTDIGSEGPGGTGPMFVIDLSYMFGECSNLVTIEKWEIPLEMMIDANMDECFSGCTSLENIYVDRLTPIVNATPNNWTFYRIKNDVANHNLIVSKYEKVENTGRSSSPYKIWTTEVPYLPGDKIYLEHGADEIAYLPNPSEQEIEDLDAAIDKYFKTQSRFVTKGITQALDPENSNFVIWAKDPNSVKCNFLDVSVSMTDRDFDDVFEE